MKNKLSLFILVIGLVIVTSCDYGDTNIDPANPQDVTVNLLLPTAQARMAYFYAGDASRYNGLFTQHFTGGGRQHVVFGRNQLQPADVNTAWNQQYAGSLQDLNVIIQKAGLEGTTPSGQYSGAAKVLMANLIAVLSDLYGDIPFSEALLGTEVQTPAYDTRADIYADVHRLLQEARTELAEDSDLAIGSEDLFYAGDTDLWIKAAWTIEARIYLHEGEYESALNAASNGLESNAEDMEFICGSSPTETNPWFQFEEQRGDVIMGKFFIDQLNSTNDPRLPFYALPANYDDVVDAGADPVYVGGLAGNPSGGESKVADIDEVIMTHYTSRASAIPFISYAERLFIEAEAHLQKGTPDAAAAAEAFNQGIAASLTKVTGSASPVYLAENSATAGDIDLEKVLMQKYIALFTQVETWNDWRRTGYPVLEPVDENNFLQGNEKFLLRWPLPQGEQDFNFENWTLNQQTPITPIVTNGISWDGKVK